MQQLFMIGVGGSIASANVEIHDLQFVIADTIEDCFPVLQERWYGDTLHLDGYMVLQYIDGYTIDLSVVMDEQLYMIVYGGYNPNVIDEVHAYHFVVATSKEEAKQIAKTQYDSFLYINHVDEVIDVFESCGVRFGLRKADVYFSDNVYHHQFVKITE